MRDADIERRIHPHLAQLGLTKYWNLYVLRVPDEPVGRPRTPQRRPRSPTSRSGSDSTERVADPEDLERVRAVLGDVV